MIKAILTSVIAGSSVFAATCFADIPDNDFSKAMDKYLVSDSGQKAIGQAMENYFKKRQEDARKQQEQREASMLEEQFKNPIKYDLGNRPVKGPKDAKITILEFSDFQCPFCKRGAETMEAVLKAYPKDVKLAFANLPLPFHKEAMPSAKAALAAGKQGKFWEMHDALFENQSKLGEEFYLEQAKTLGLDVEKFKKDMASPEIEQQIKIDQELAKKHEIQGTPGFFVNGVAVKGAYPLEHFKKIIDRWLSGETGKKAA